MFLFQNTFMAFKRLHWLILAIIIILPGIVEAQISQGGIPMKTSVLKSTGKKVVEMPPIENFLYVEGQTFTGQSENMLKPFQFAYPFEVNFSTGNSGEWYRGENGFLVWKLTIRSGNAKSINLIFDEFELPEYARLFMFNEDNGYILGAYTSFNNSPSGKFAVSPVLGEEVTVQYEVPEGFENERRFRIVRVNHDYVGILKASDRRPLNKLAGPCNIDINCDTWNDWENEKNAVCRMIVNGKEICTGVLLNNTAENRKPYILSAAHCYDFWNYPDVTVYTFNYESPFCKPLDGDPLNSISGAKMKAKHDSLDFAIVELSSVPPARFRPYFAGWDCSDVLPASSVTITHPQGDVKKISSDKDPPIIFDFEKAYTKNGFLKILRWESGVTEAGSSGGPLFNQNKKVVGTLTGGVAVCKNPVNDYFSRFALAWDYKPDSARQLKYWLDPVKSGVKVLEGKQFNKAENLCGAFTNLVDMDDYNMVPLTSSNKFSGYWGGSNSLGITEFMERYSLNGNEILSGVSFGVGKFSKALKSAESEIKIKVYKGNNLPEELIYSKNVKTSGFAEDAMNFVGFSENVKPGKTFFVGFELSNVQPLDSFVVYQSLRNSGFANSFYFKQNNKWYNFKDANSNGKSMANIFEIIACNIDNFNTDTPLVDNPQEILIFPNPSNSVFTVAAGQDFTENQVEVFNLLGQKIIAKTERISGTKVKLDLSGNIPGVYFVRMVLGKEIVSQKISYVPW